MNASTAAIKSVTYNQFGRVGSRTIAALAMVSIVASLVHVSGLEALPTSAPSLTPRAQPMGYFPAQFELKPATNEASVFEY